MKNNYPIAGQPFICCFLILLVSGCATPGARLNKAIRTNHYEAVAQQLSTNIDINASGNLYSTPLITAIHYQNRDIIKLLLANGADPNKADREALEPLKEAIKLKDYEIVRLLLNSGADPAQGECDALYVAIENIADDVMVNILVNNGADLHKKHVYDVLTYQEAQDTFAELPPRPNQDADLSPPIVMSGSALFVAVSKGYSDIARVLLERGADIDEIDTHGRTPLMIAVIYNQMDTAKLLLNYGPDLSLRDQAKNALKYAIEHKSDDMADLLKNAMKKTI